MKCNLNNCTKESIGENFPSSLNDIKVYLQNQKLTMKRISDLSHDKDNDTLSSKDYFENLLSFCSLSLEADDLNMVIKTYLGHDYKIALIKSEIPEINYDIKNECTVKSLINLYAAVPSSFNLEEDHIYSADELMHILKKHEVVFLAKGKPHKSNISIDEYIDALGKYNHKEITFINCDKISRFNLNKLITAYPEMLSIIRNGMDSAIIFNVLREYNELLNKAIDGLLVNYDREIEENNQKKEFVKTYRNNL